MAYNISYSFTTLDDPKGIGTSAHGINDAGQIVGDYVDSNSKFHGFVYSNGVYTTVDIPGAFGTYLTAINNTGEIAGYYLDQNLYVEGFIYSGGTVTKYLSDTDPTTPAVHT
jgi:probable HAF family extracellular repeat protein